MNNAWLALVGAGIKSPRPNTVLAELKVKLTTKVSIKVCSVSKLDLENPDLSVC